MPGAAPSERDRPRKVGRTALREETHAGRNVFAGGGNLASFPLSFAPAREGTAHPKTGAPPRPAYPARRP
jgi:hypothetical protein